MPATRYFDIASAGEGTEPPSRDRQSRFPARPQPLRRYQLQSLGIAPSAINQAWSISTEFAAYFCFPLFVALVLFGGRRAVMATAALAVLLLATAIASIMHDGAWHSGSLDAYDGTHFAPLLRCLGGFLLGMLAFRLGSVPQLTGLAARDSVGLLILIAVAVLLAVGAPDLVVVALFPAVVVCLATNAGAPAAVFANPVIYALGLWPYAIYLLHPLLQRPRDVVDGYLLSHLPPNPAAIIASLGVGAVLLTVFPRGLPRDRSAWTTGGATDCHRNDPAVSSSGQHLALPTGDRQRGQADCRWSDQ